MGICYGLGRLNDTLHQTGVFGTRLMEMRDAYCSSNGTPEQSKSEGALKKGFTNENVSEYPFG